MIERKTNELSFDFQKAEIALMRTLFLLLLIATAASLFSQKTRDIITYPDGSKSYKLFHLKDTLLIRMYPNGKKESVRPLKNNESTGTYSRWYENGKLMWEKELINGIQNGKSVYYNDKGDKVAELIYLNGKITDTIFIKENTHIILGKISASSTVLGGAENADGTSNVSESSGPFMNCYMYAAKVDSFMKPKFISSYKSDDHGDFFITAPIGKIGFFPSTTEIESLKPGQFTIPETSWNGGNSGWSKQGPIVVTERDIILMIEFHHASVGYAP